MDRRRAPGQEHYVVFNSEGQPMIAPIDTPVEELEERVKRISVVNPHLRTTLKTLEARPLTAEESALVLHDAEITPVLIGDMFTAGADSVTMRMLCNFAASSPQTQAILAPDALWNRLANTVRVDDESLPALHRLLSHSLAAERDGGGYTRVATDALRVAMLRGEYGDANIALHLGADAGTLLPHHGKEPSTRTPLDVLLDNTIVLAQSYTGVPDTDVFSRWNLCRSFAARRGGLSGAADAPPGSPEWVPWNVLKEVAVRGAHRWNEDAIGFALRVWEASDPPSSSSPPNRPLLLSTSVLPELEGSGYMRAITGLQPCTYASLRALKRLGLRLEGYQTQLVYDAFGTLEDTVAKRALLDRVRLSVANWEAVVREVQRKAAENQPVRRPLSTLLSGWKADKAAEEKACAVKGRALAEAFDVYLGASRDERTRMRDEAKDACTRERGEVKYSFQSINLQHLLVYEVADEMVEAIEVASKARVLLARAGLETSDIEVTPKPQTSHAEWEEEARAAACSVLRESGVVWRAHPIHPNEAEEALLAEAEVVYSRMMEAPMVAVEGGPCAYGPLRARHDDLERRIAELQSSKPRV